MFKNLGAQSCNNVCNPHFLYSNSIPSWEYERPFKYNCTPIPAPSAFPVPCWEITHGTAQLDGFYSVNPAYAGLMWCLRSSTTFYGEGIGNFLSLSVQQGRPYYFMIHARKLDSTNVDTMNIIFLTNSASSSNYFNAKQCTNLLNAAQATLPGIPAPHQIIMQRKVSSFGFQIFDTCNIIPSDNWNYLWIFPKTDTTQNKIPWLGVVDAELIPQFDYAGSDKQICAGECVDIGQDCTIDSFITQVYVWYELPSNTVVGSTKKITVCPPITKQYVLKRTLNGCDAYDTVLVTVRQKPWVNLGADRIVCKGDSTQIGINDSGYVYSWGAGYPATSKIWVKSSGTYILTVCDSGCCNSDTINIIFNPIFQPRQNPIKKCITSFPDTICTIPGMSKYVWTPGGDTTQCKIIGGPGLYICMVTDTNGCVGYDTFNIITINPFTINLGPDTILCGQDSFDLVADSGYYSYLWSTSETTQSIRLYRPGSYTIWVKVCDRQICCAYDTITVVFADTPTVSLDDGGCYCRDESPFTLTTGHPSGGWYSGSGITYPNTFTPSDAGCGAIKYFYHFIDSNGCENSDSNWIRVMCPSTDILMPDSIFCLGDKKALIMGLPYGGTFTGSGISKVGLNWYFTPSVAGRGKHKIRYFATDTCGAKLCKSQDSIWLTVTSPVFDVVGDKIFCEGDSTTIRVVTNDTTLRFLWSPGGDTTSYKKIGVAGLYYINVFDSNDCWVQKKVNITREDLCDLEPTIDREYEVTYGNTYVWQDETVVINADQDVIIRNGGRLVIEDSRVIPGECSRIIVEDGGALVIRNSYIGQTCCKWKGIEIWGQYNSCQPDTIDNTINTPPAFLQGKLIMEYSVISGADIAVFAGRREDNGATDHRLYGGGLLIINGSTFRHNYVDIALSEYDAPGNACANPPFDCNYANPYTGYDSTYYLSHITNNLFDYLKDAEECTTFITDNLNIYQTDTNGNGQPFYASGAGNTCNIIDFGDNQFVWSFVLCNSIACPFCCSCGICESRRRIFHNNIFLSPWTGSNPLLPCGTIGTPERINDINNGYK